VSTGPRRTDVRGVAPRARLVGFRSDEEWEGAMSEDSRSRDAGGPDSEEARRRREIEASLAQMRPQERARPRADRERRAAAAERARRGPMNARDRGDDPPPGPHSA
jgi:hypothetical protein